MRPVPRCLDNARRALYRVFVCPPPPPPPPPAAPLPTVRHAGGGVAAQLRRYASASQPRYRVHRARSAAAEDDADMDADDDDAAVAGRGRGTRVDSRYTTQQAIDRSGRDRPPRDHEITDPYIMVIDGAAPEGPLATSFVLTKLEPHESLRMVKPYQPADPREGRRAPQLAVCKVVDKKKEYERERQRKEQRKEGKPKTKELEFTWAIAEHDLATKMRQMAAFLAKGMKVEVALGRKRRANPPADEDAAAVLRKVRETSAAVDARESKPMSGDVGGNLRLFFEGKRVA